MKTWVINSFGPGCQQPAPEYPVCSTSPPPQGQDALSPSHMVLSPQLGLAQPISEGQMLRCCQTLNSHLCKAVPLQLLSIRNHKWAWDAIKISIFDVESKDLCKDLDLCDFPFHCPPFSVTLRLPWTWSHGWIQNTVFPSFVGLPVLFSGPVIASLSIEMFRELVPCCLPFTPCCFGYDQGQSYRTEFAKINIHCLFHRNWFKAPCLPCISLNVLKSVSLLELLIFQIFLKSFTVSRFSSQGYVLDVFGFLCQSSAFPN